MGRTVKVKAQKARTDVAWMSRRKHINQRFIPKEHEESVQLASSFLPVFFLCSLLINSKFTNLILRQVNYKEGNKQITDMLCH